MQRVSCLLIVIILLLSSCQSGRKDYFYNAPLQKQCDIISFLVEEKYIAELSCGEIPTLLIPELGIIDLEMKEYQTDADIRIFTQTAQRINIILYQDHLVLMMKDGYEQISWSRKGMLYDFYEKT